MNDNAPYIVGGLLVIVLGLQIATLYGISRLRARLRNRF